MRNLPKSGMLTWRISSCRILQFIVSTATWMPFFVQMLINICNMDALLRSDAHKYLLLKDGAIVQIETLFEIKNKEMLLQSIMEKEAALSGISGCRPGSSS